MLNLSEVDRLAYEAAAAALKPLVPTRVYSARTTDSTGAAALLITIVLPDDYETQMREGGTGDAIIRVHEALERAGDERWPILDYATEQDLAEDALADDGDP